MSVVCCQLSFLLKQCLDLLCEGCLGGCTYGLVYYLAVLDEDDGGDVAYAKLAGEVVVVVNVALADNNTSFILLGQGFDVGSNFFLGSTPCSPEVYYYGFTLSEEGLEIAVCDLYCHNVIVIKF